MAEEGFAARCPGCRTERMAYPEGGDVEGTDGPGEGITGVGWSGVSSTMRDGIQERRDRGGRSCS